MTTTPAPPRDHGRAGRNLPVAIAASLVFWKTAFMLIVAAAVVIAIWELHRGFLAKGIDLPELTEERRKEYIKMAKGKAEDGRIAVRNIRRTATHALEKLEKDGEVGKDDVTGAEKRLDGTTKKHTDAIDEMLKAKEAELLEV